MAHLVGRIAAPALAASLVMTLAGVAAHAETPAAASASNCLAKPSGPTAKGSHWYYRVEHPSGRHCWYQHAMDSVRIVRPHPHAATEMPELPPRAAAPAPAPERPPVSEASAAPAVNVMPPVAAPPIAAPVNEPPAWPAIAAVPAAPPAPPVATAADRVPVSSVESPPPPAPEPKNEALQPQLDAMPSKHPPARPPSVVHNGEFAEQSSHVPALLGAVSALVIIIIGSFAGRLLTQRSRRRPQASVRPRDWQSPISGMEEEAPGIVPTMPGGDTARVALRDVPPPTSPDDFGLRHVRAPRPVASGKTRRPSPSATPPNRESTRVLEANVRELLHRLQSDLRGQPAKSAMPAAAAAAPAHVPTEQQLDAVLAMWRTRRSG